MSALVEYRRCTNCQRPMSPARPTPSGCVRYGAYGRCNACDRKLERAGIDRRTHPERQAVRAADSDVWPRRP